MLAGREVQGSGPGALDSQEDSVTQRYREAVNNGLTTVRMFASGGEGDGKALESSPGAISENINRMILTKSDFPGHTYTM